MVNGLSNSFDQARKLSCKNGNEVQIVLEDLVLYVKKRLSSFANDGMEPTLPLPVPSPVFHQNLGLQFRWHTGHWYVTIAIGYVEPRYKEWLVYDALLYNWNIIRAFDFCSFRAPHDSAKITSFKSCYYMVYFECLNAHGCKWNF